MKVDNLDKKPQPPVLAVLRRIGAAGLLVLVSGLVCSGLFAVLVLLWGLLMAPWVQLQAAGPVLLLLFAAAAALTLWLWSIFSRRWRSRDSVRP
ncbi:MAG: hypothetical protein KKI09_11050 [Spirochaetes bacterium]|nr:hypothetical protein [Spirochaetota bacterium]